MSKKTWFKEIFYEYRKQIILALLLGGSYFAFNLIRDTGENIRELPEMKRQIATLQEQNKKLEEKFERTEKKIEWVKENYRRKGQ